MTHHYSFLLTLCLIPFPLRAAQLPCDDEKAPDTSPHLTTEANSAFDLSDEDNRTRIMADDQQLLPTSIDAYAIDQKNPKRQSPNSKKNTEKSRKPLDPDTEKQWWEALQTDNTTKVKEMLTRFIIDTNQANKDGRTPLHIAAYNGHTAMCQYLVEKCKADSNKADKDGRTPLYSAAQHGHTTTCQYLIKGANADVNQANKWGETPLYEAASNGHKATCQYFLESTNADVNQAMNSGWTPLHIAAEKGHTATCRYLAEVAKANVNKKNEWGETPLYVAAQNVPYRHVPVFGRKR